VLRDGRDQPVTLGPRLGRGGEGEVFAVEGKADLVAKILAPARRQGKAEKVQAMVANPPAGAYDLIEGLPVLTWPRDTLRDGRDFAGYTMTRVRPGDFVPFYQLTTAARRSGLGGTPITFDRLVLLAMRLCHVVRTLHRFGYAVGDLNDRNVLVSRRLTPLLMDTDSFQVPRAGRGHHACLVGDALYWPPELLDVDLAKHPVDRQSSDRYALGVLLFQLFMDGLRPYQSRGSAVDGLESLADKTRAGHYPWATPRKGVLEPPASAPSYLALPRPLRAAFERCFVAGHRKPAKRPTADEWYATLAQVRANGFQACARTARHVYPNGERSCPWCADTNDPFDGKPAAKPSPRPVRQVVMRHVAQRPTGAAKPGMRKATTPRQGGAKARPSRSATPPQRPRTTALVFRPAPANVAVVPAKPTGPPAHAKPRARAPAPRPKAKAKAKAVGKKAKRRRPARRRSRWLAKARWLTALTGAVLATYVWMAS
jgi:DNA-binding helix-hairpin-helix protein with protein kinase domain